MQIVIHEMSIASLLKKFNQFSHINLEYGFYL